MSENPTPENPAPENPAPENPAPYTGRPQPAFPTQYLPQPLTLHSRVLLIAVIAIAFVAAVLNGVGGQGFPGAAPVEQAYCFLIIVDLMAVAVTVGALTLVEFLRRRDPGRMAQPLNTRISIFAIIAVVLSAVAVIGWGIGGGVEQLGYLLSGVRGRYMYHTGGLVLTGIPWVLGAIFGAWGFRPGGHRVTNILAIVAVAIWFVLTVVVTIAAIVYGLGGSD